MAVPLPQDRPFHPRQGIAIRIPFGLDRLPRATGPDDTRLRGVTVGAERLRLNTEPLPADIMPAATGDHAARVAAATDWLAGLCGDYAPLQRQFVACYFGFVAAHIEAHRVELAERLGRYDGLYAPEDWTWSALRPLPRVWLPVEGRMLPADIGFWDGTQPIAIELSARDTERAAALRGAGITVLRIEPAVLTGDPMRVGEILPDSFQYFWRGQALPSSPFRRPIPHDWIASLRSQ